MSNGGKVHKKSTHFGVFRRELENNVFLIRNTPTGRRKKDLEYSKSFLCVSFRIIIRLMLPLFYGIATLDIKVANFKVICSANKSSK